MKKILCIVDPWETILPYDSERHPYLQNDTNIFCEFIHSQLPRLHNAVDEIVVIDSNRPVNKLFAHLPHDAMTYTEIDGLNASTTDYVYFCGFALNRCINAKIKCLIEDYNYNIEQIGIVHNLSMSHPDCQIYLDSSRKSTAQKYHWDMCSKFISYNEFL